MAHLSCTMCYLLSFMLTPGLERRVEPRKVITKGMACLKRHGKLIECARVIATGSPPIPIDPAYPCARFRLAKHNKPHKTTNCTHHSLDTILKLREISCPVNRCQFLAHLRCAGVGAGAVHGCTVVCNPDVRDRVAKGGDRE
jgi:hypothetical protein